MTNATITGRTIERELYLRATPERVWRALTEKEELERWFVTEAHFDPTPGAPWRFRWRKETGQGEVVTAEPPHLLVMTWDEGESLGTTTLTITLTPDGDGTRLHLVQSGFGGGDDWDRLYDGVDSGWTQALDDLRRWLDDGQAKLWG
jgi:uncharacterized protein YndB with AHSA1/START domain